MWNFEDLKPNNIIIHVILILRFNNGFSPLIFPKLRFWHSNKKTTKPPPKFCTCGNFDYQGQFWLSLRWRGTLSELSRIIFFLFFFALGAKTAIVVKHRGWFCSFFPLRDQNYNFIKIRRQKLLFSLNLNQRYVGISAMNVE